MYKEHDYFYSTVIGAITATSIGSFLFQTLGAFVIGVVGALGGYLFARFLKPRLDKLFPKKNDPKA